MDRRPTQADVAKAAGVHRATVTLTLKNHPSIPAKTKKRVLECAKKLGYSPDPMLSSLAAYRSRLRPKAFQGTVAWLANDFIEGQIWSNVVAFKDYYDGALSRAKTHGFVLDTFDLGNVAVSKNHLVSIFRNRNISGILLPPQPCPNVEVDFPWDGFSAVTFGYSIIKPQLHTVTATHFRSMVQTMRQLKLLGYKRIGFCFSAPHDEKTDHNFLAGYLVETFAKGKGAAIPPFNILGANVEKFRKWYEQYRPEAVVTGYRDILTLLDAAGIRCPDELGVANPLLERDMLKRERRLAGIYEDSFHIGEVAMDLLVAMIHRGERGVPRQSQKILVEGTWKVGDTLRQIPNP